MSKKNPGRKGGIIGFGVTALVLGSIFSGGGLSLMGIAVIGCLPVKNLLNKVFTGRKSRACVNALGTVFLSAVVVLSVLFLVGQSYNPFIYFRF